MHAPWLSSIFNTNGNSCRCGVHASPLPPWTPAIVCYVHMYVSPSLPRIQRSGVPSQNSSPMSSRRCSGKQWSAESLKTSLKRKEFFTASSLQRGRHYKEKRVERGGTNVLVNNHPGFYLEVISLGKMVKGRYTLGRGLGPSPPG